MCSPLALALALALSPRSHLTGAIAALRTYFADYKLAATGRRNQFAFGGAAVSRARAVEAVREAHRQWDAAFGGARRKQSATASA